MRRSISFVFIITSLGSLGIGACLGDFPSEGPLGQQSFAISECGPTPPTVGVCEKVTCGGPPDLQWVIDPLPNNTPCNGTGKCDGNGSCSVASPPPPPPGPPRVFDFTTAEITELQVDFPGGPLTYETRNCSPGADPVLHLFTPGSSSDERVELAVDDNGGGGVNAKIAVTPPSGGIGFLILRAQSDQFGTCDIWRNGLPWQFGKSAGGKTIDVGGVFAGDVVETISMPHGGTTQAIYWLSGSNITKKIRSGTGTGQSASFVMTSSNKSFLVHGHGPTRVIVNDVAFDTDGDGLGDSLERQLKTCPDRVSIIDGFECWKIKAAQDTDGDGLSDAWEVLGKRDQVPHQLLPHWGSNPRHKDIFVEVDYRLKPGEPEPVRLSPETAREIRGFWDDTNQPLSPTTAALHASLLRNPDRLPGVSVHLDTGVVPAFDAPPDDHTLYGNWGGSSHLPADTHYATAWRTAMSPARRGVFQWGLGAQDPGGQTSGSRFSFTADVKSGLMFAHEMGHTLRIDHYGHASAGALNCKPNYTSVMNYSYTGAGVGFSDGSGPPAMNNVSLLEFNHLLNVPNRDRYADLYEQVFKYYVDRTTWSVDFDRDGEIAPAGTRVRAYANSGLADGACEGVRERRNALNDGADTMHSPALARLGGKVMVFTPTDAGLVVRIADDTFFGCTGAGGGEFDNPCGSFSAPTPLISGAVVAVDVEPVRFGAATPTLAAFVWVDASGELWGSGLHMVSGRPKQFLVPVRLSNQIKGEPSLAAGDDGRVRLIFKDGSDVVWESDFGGSPGWGPVRRALGPSGPFHVRDAPGIVRGRMPGDTADAFYMHATHDVEAIVRSRWLKYDDGDATWKATSFKSNVSTLRPGLAYVPSVIEPTRGTIYALSTQPYGDVPNAVRMRTSRVEVQSVGETVTKTPQFDIDQWFDNAWSSVFGLDLMFEPGRDTNLRAAVVYDFGKMAKKTAFLPLADGIVDLEYSGFNDWEQIGNKLCASVANPENTVPNPIPCF